MCINIHVNHMKMKRILFMKQTFLHQLPLLHYHEVMIEKVKTVQLYNTLTVSK